LLSFLIFLYFNCPFVPGGNCPFSPISGVASGYAEFKITPGQREKAIPLNLNGDVYKFNIADERTQQLTFTSEP